jgi:hypothetical protein
VAKRVTKGNLWGFIQSRPYVSMADIRRLFTMDVDGAASLATNEGPYYIGLPQEAADFIRQLWQEGRIILDLNPDVKARVVQGVYPARVPVNRAAPGRGAARPGGSSGARPAKPRGASRPAGAPGGPGGPGSPGWGPGAAPAASAAWSSAPTARVLDAAPQDAARPVAAPSVPGAPGAQSTAGPFDATSAEGGSGGAGGAAEDLANGATGKRRRRRRRRGPGDSPGEASGDGPSDGGPDGGAADEGDGAAPAGPATTATLLATAGD